MVPMAQVTINFRLDLRQWDIFLEEHNRTVDDPFEQTLADLALIVATIHPVNDDFTSANTDVTLNITE